MSRQTIKENPLDALLSEPPSAKKTEQISKPKPAPDENGELKQRLTVQISAEILDRAKNAVYWTRGLTLAQLTEQALEKAIRELEKKSIVFDDQTGEALKSKGDQFPERREELKSGRPVK